jgi:hypothetical protein
MPRYREGAAFSIYRGGLISPNSFLAARMILVSRAIFDR